MHGTARVRGGRGCVPLCAVKVLTRWGEHIIDHHSLHDLVISRKIYSHKQRRVRGGGILSELHLTRGSSINISHPKHYFEETFVCAIRPTFFKCASPQQKLQVQVSYKLNQGCWLQEVNCNPCIPTVGRVYFMDRYVWSTEGDTVSWVGYYCTSC